MYLTKANLCKALYHEFYMYMHKKTDHMYDNDW